MRPKRRILILDSDDQRASELGYFLRIRGFDTPTVMDAGAELVLAIMPNEEEQLQALLAAKYCNCQVLLVTTPISNTDLYQQVLIRSARKRGPKKGYRKPPHSVQPATEVMATA